MNNPTCVYNEEVVGSGNCPFNRPCGAIIDDGYDKPCQYLVDETEYRKEQEESK